MTRVSPPVRPAGYRRDGRPIWPIRGASPDDPSNQPDRPPTPALSTGSTTPPGSPAPTVTLSQEDLTRLCAKEKDQGRRAGLRDLLGQTGFDSAKALTDFVEQQRQAEEERKTAERARMSEVERREQEAAEREKDAIAREAAAAAKEREAARRSLLAGLGAVGEDLEDALVLLNRVAGDDADEQTVARAADELKERRKGLFGQPAPELSAAPAGSPAGGVPSRPGPGAAKPGDGGRAMARRRGYLND